MPRNPMMQRGKVISELIVHIFKSVALELLKTNNYTSSADSVLILAGIWMGEAEGRPMTTAKLAQYIGMPRPTVGRKVDDLIKRGIVKDAGRGRFVFVLSDEQRVPIGRIIEGSVKHIHSASRKLSRMDNG